MTRERKPPKSPKQKIHEAYAWMAYMGVEPVELPEGERGVLAMSLDALADIGEGSRKKLGYTSEEREWLKKLHKHFGEEHIKRGYPPSTRKIWVDDAVARCSGRPIGEIMFYHHKNMGGCEACAKNVCQYGHGPHNSRNQHQIDHHNLLLSQGVGVHGCVEKLGFGSKGTYRSFISKNKLEKPHDWYTTRRGKPVRQRKLTYSDVREAMKRYEAQQRSVVDSVCSLVRCIEKLMSKVDSLERAVNRCAK